MTDSKYDTQTTRYYCPISRIDDVGMFDLLVHGIYSEEKNFSTHITTLNVSSSNKLARTLSHY
jgi:cytochrome-b5 reductase